MSSPEKTVAALPIAPTPPSEPDATVTRQPYATSARDRYTATRAATRVEEETHADRLLPGGADHYRVFGLAMRDGPAMSISGGDRIRTCVGRANGFTARL